MGAALELEGLIAGYGPLRVLDGIDLRAASGSITALIGANGAGKTTTLRAISGIVKTKGRISLDGDRIDGLATEKIAQRGIAHVPGGTRDAQQSDGGRKPAARRPSPDETVGSRP